MNSKYLFAALLLFVGIAGCASDSTTQTTTSNSLPTLGSLYTFRDSSSVIQVPPTDIVYKIVQVNGNTYAWRQDSVDVFFDTTRFWYRIESNGNLSADPQPVSLSRADWLIMPFGSTGSITSKETYKDGSEDHVRMMTSTHEGDGTYTLSGKQYTTHGVKVTDLDSNITGGYSETTIYHYKYAPELGVYVAYDQEDLSQGTQEVHHQRLTSIVRK